MNARGLRRYVDDLLRGRRPRPFAPDDFEAAQVRTAIELRAAREGGDAPRPEFVADLHRRVAEQMSGAPTETAPSRGSTRRQVIVGTSAAATAAVAAVSVDRTLIAGRAGDGRTPEFAAGQLTAQRGQLAARRGQFGRARRRHARLRPRLGDRIRPARRR